MKYMLTSLKGLIIKNTELIYNIVGSIGVKGLSLIINLMTVPAYLTYFSDQRVLGVWFSLLSVLNWIYMFDMGIGNGLRNHLVQALVEKDYLIAKKYISSSYVIVGVLSLFIACVGYLLIGYINWNLILNVSSNIIVNQVLITAIRFVFIGIIIHFFLKLVTSILYAMQKTALSNFITLLAQSLILVFVLIFKATTIESALINLSKVYVFTANIPLLLATIFIFLGPLKEAKPNIKFYSSELAKGVLKLGSMFFWIQLTLLIINSSNEILITQLYGPEKVVEYQIYNRIFNLYYMFFTILTTPIWSAITKAYTEKRILWIKKVQRYLYLSTFILSIFCLLTSMIFDVIVKLWLGNEALKVNIQFSFVFAIFYIIMMFINSVTCVANGIGELKTQLIMNSFAAMVKIPLTILLAFIFDSWIVIMIANIIIMIPAMIVHPIKIHSKLQNNIAISLE